MPKLRATDILSGLGSAVGKQGLDFLGGKSLGGLGAKHQQLKFFKMLKTHNALSPEHQKIAAGLATGSKLKSYSTTQINGFTKAVFRLGKAGKLPTGYGIKSTALARGAGNVVKSIAQSSGEDPQKLALQEKEKQRQEMRQRAIRRAQFERAREAQQVPVAAKPGMGKPATPMTPLTSVSRLPETEQQKKVSIGELETEAHPPQTSVGQPKESVQLTGSNAGVAPTTGVGRDIQAPATPIETPAVPGEEPVTKADDDAPLPDPGKAEDMEI